MLRNASIVHRIPGRMRLRIPSAKADSEFLEQARAAVAQLPHVLEVSCNPLTGSLLITYPRESQREFEDTLILGNGSPMPFVLQVTPQASTDPARKPRGRPQHSDLSRAVSDVVAAIDDAVRESTGNLLDLRTLLPLAMGGIGLTWMGRTKGTPLWLTLMIFAFSSFVALHGSGAEFDGEFVAEQVLE